MIVAASPVPPSPGCRAFTFSSQRRYERCLSILGEAWTAATRYDDAATGTPTLAARLATAVLFHADLSSSTEN